MGYSPVVSSAATFTAPAFAAPAFADSTLADSAAGPMLDYCREARRLRGRWGADPTELQSRLRALAHRRDAARAKLARPQVRRSDPVRYRPALDIPNHNVSRRLIDQFIDAVMADLDGPVLRYSQRQALLRGAGRLGISRFHANLIIASVQHQYGDRLPPGGARPSRMQPASTRIALFAWASVILVAEFTAAVIAWRHLAG